MQDLFDDDAGHKARDVGTKKVLSNNKEWVAKGLVAFKALPSGWVGTGETVRFVLRPVIGSPTNQNAWGALILNIVRKGLVEPTGNLVHLKSTKSHARLTREYRKV